MLAGVGVRIRHCCSWRRGGSGVLSSRWWVVISLSAFALLTRGRRTQMACASPAGADGVLTSLTREEAAGVPL